MIAIDSLINMYCTDWFFLLNPVSDLCVFQPCRNGATCVGNTTAFTCECASGFTGRICDTGKVTLVKNRLFSDNEP